MLRRLLNVGIQTRNLFSPTLLTSIAALAGLMLSGNIAGAQPTLNLRFPFDDATGTTTPSDTSGGGANVTLLMVSPTFAATNLHGAQYSGVAGLTTGSRALNLSANVNQGGGGSFACVTNANLGFGNVSSFVATMWMKQSRAQSGNTLGRMFYLGNTTNASDVGVVNSIGMKWQGPNQLYFYVNTVTCSTFFPQADTNGWIFVAMTYDGSNVVLYEGTDINPAVALATIAAPSQSVGIAAATACLSIGNRPPGGRDFPGWIDDFRFYTGTGATAAFVEGIRQASAGPSGLVAVPNNNVVNLTWNALSGAASYNVKRATTSGGPYTTISTAGTVTTPAYTDSTAVNGTTYYYTVSAVNGSAVETANSVNEASATPSVPPAAPTITIITPGSYNVALTWSASAGATKYNVKRSTTSGAEVTVATVTSGLTYTDTGLVNGVLYYYEVSALNSTGSESVNSTEMSATPVGPPPPPANLVAAGAGIQQIGLTWSASYLATSYNVYRATSSGGAYTSLASGVTATSYIDATVVDSAAYYYKVTAVNGNGESPLSAAVSATGITPKLRYDFSDTGTTTVDSINSVSLNMVNGSNVATDIHGPANSGVAGAGKALNLSSNLYQSPPSGPLASTTNNTALNFGVVSNFTVTFWVKPTYDLYTPAPGAPDMSVSNNSRLFILSPTNYADYPAAIPAAQAGLYMKVNSYDASAHHGELKVYLSSGISTTEYVTPENSFVSATGLWSFVAITFDGSTLNLYSATATNSANLILSVATNMPAMGFTNLTGGNLLLGNRGDLAKGFPGWMSDFRFYSGAGGTGFVENVRLLAAAPPSSVAALGGNNQVGLTWGAFSGATSYNVKRATASGGPYTAIATGLTGTSYTDTTAINNSTYYYVISAASPYGESANSAEANATASCTPPPTVGNNGPICAGSTLNLTASTVADATYSWTGPNGFTSSDQNPSIANATTAAAGTYSVTVTVGACTSAPATTVVTVNATAAPTAGNNGPLCEGSTLNLTASTVPGATYSWTGPDGFTSTSQNPSIANATTAASGTYSVTATANGCASPAGTTIAVVNAIPAAPTAGNNGPVCAGSDLILTASTVAGATYSWTGPNGFTSSAQIPEIEGATTAASGLYSVTVTVNGCTSAAGTTTATVNAAPAAPTAGNDGPINAGATLNLTASTVAGATYSWTGPNGFTSTDQSPSIVNATTNATGLYSVTATVGSCTSPAGTTTATVNGPLEVTMTIQASGTNITIGWPSGTLQSATNVLGPWNDVTGAAPPSYTATNTEPQQFFRVR